MEQNLLPDLEGALWDEARLILSELGLPYDERLIIPPRPVRLEGPLRVLRITSAGPDQVSVILAHQFYRPEGRPTAPDQEQS